VDHQDRVTLANVDVVLVDAGSDFVVFAGPRVDLANGLGQFVVGKAHQ
jgi:hypothetical protein